MSDSLPPCVLWPARLLCPWDSSGKNTGVGCHALLQRIFLTQGSSPHILYLLHWHVGCFPLVPPGKPIRVHISFQLVLLFSMDKYPDVKSLGHMVVLFLIFWGISDLFANTCHVVFKLFSFIFVSHLLLKKLEFSSALRVTCFLLSYGWLFLAY